MADPSGRNYFVVQKSENDPRNYRLIELPNKLKVLLISDEVADKAAASVDVHIGNFADPDEVPGIAHFCEHMLFLGTDKYPVENDFTEFISQNGGSQNAYTSVEHTNYHFSVKCSALESALDRFSQFFICPRFDEDSTDRELNAIDSEHQKNILVDGRRKAYIDKFTSRNNSVYRKFGTGNLETLKTIPEEKGIDIRKLLLDFHRKYYSSNIINVAVIGNNSLDDLESMVIPKFENVANKNTIIPKYTEHPYGPDQVGVTLNIKTVKQLKTLQLQFPVPAYSNMYKEKPDHYVSHLIGHEGKGSLLSLLKKKSLVHSLSAGTQSAGECFEFFIVSMELSEEGLKNVNDVIGYVFQYIKLLNSEEPKEWIFKELKMFSEIQFRFKEKAPPRQYVSSLTKTMHEFAPEHVLNGNFLMESFRPDIIKELLEYLKPDKFRCFLLTNENHKHLEYEKIKYYDAEYNITKIPEETIKNWESLELHPDLYLPDKNPFVPETLEVKAEKKFQEVKSIPELIKDTNMVRVWHKQDDTFYLPKASLKVHICSPVSSLTPSHVIHLRLFLELLEDELNEYLYDATLAGIKDGTRGTSMGILLIIGGYNDKMLIYLEKIFAKMINLPIKQDRFDLQIEQFEQQYKNYETVQPYRQIGEVTNHLMEERFWSNEELLESLKDISVVSLRSFIAAFMKNIYIESLYCGNLTLADATKFTETVERVFMEENKAGPMLPIQHLLSREYQLPEGCSYLMEKRNKIHTMSCVQVYLQVGLQETRMNVLCELFAVMIREPAFDTLRTKEQLGYLTFSGLGRSTSVQGVKVLIQSDKAPAFVEERIDQFLSSYKETLNSMSDETFHTFVEALVVQKLEKPKRIGEEASRYWQEIIIKQYHFRRGEDEVEELRRLKKEDIVMFYKKYISPESKARKKITVVVLGKDAESLVNGADLTKNWTGVIDDVVTFKTTLPLYPLLLPVSSIPLIANTKARL